MSKRYTEEGRASYKYLIDGAVRQLSFIYFAIESDDDSPVKIGTTLKTPHHRLNDFPTGNWRELRVRQVLIGDEHDEERIHTAFAPARIRGEWFGNGYQGRILEFADMAADLQCRLRLRELCTEKSEDERSDAEYERIVNSIMVANALETFALEYDFGVAV